MLSLPIKWFMKRGGFAVRKKFHKILMGNDRAKASSRRIGVFSSSVLKTLSNSGSFHVEFDPPRYPRDAQRGDLERIGGDMYRAWENEGRHRREGKKTEALTRKRRMERSVA